MNALDEIVELYEAQHSDGYVAKRFRSIEGPKLVAIAQAAQRLLDHDLANVKLEDTDFHAINLDALVHSAMPLFEVLKKMLVALDTTPHRSDEIRREIDDLECKIDELERELESVLFDMRETGDCEGFAID